MGLTAAAEAFPSLPEAQIIRKLRYAICYDYALVWWVDCFQRANSDLVLAEVELASPDPRLDLPASVGREIIFDRRYGNSRRARSPMPLVAHAV